MRCEQGTQQRSSHGDQRLVAACGPLRAWSSPMVMPISRRSLLTLVAALLAPQPARAQKVTAPPRIGWLSSEPPPDPFLDGFREGLRQHGYVEGQSVILELRSGSRHLDALHAAVSELITQSQVHFIIASGPAIRALKAAKEAWVLFVVSGDPVELGIATSLAHPGGTFTGITLLSLEIAGKRIELLKEAMPQLRTLAALSNTDHPGESAERRATEAAAQALGISLIYVPFRQFPFDVTGELDTALDAVRRARPDALVVFPEGATLVNRVKIAQFAIAQRLPSMFGWSEYCDAGGLMSYGANQRDAYVRLAAFADKLLRGAKPTDLPIEQPTRFELVLNLKTAGLLGIALPPLVMFRADRLIR
jgi:putative tryptophan/tyrosine transport system substrate-binding protein